MEAHHDTIVETGDHVILFITDKRQTDEVERLFQEEVKFQ
jgi:trk system potassium uptake protein TrkA